VGIIGLYYLIPRMIQKTYFTFGGSMSPIAKFTGALLTLIFIALSISFAADESKSKVTATAPTPTVAPVAQSGAEVGKKAPEFSLVDTEGKTQTLKQYLDANKTVVLYWFNANCPVVVRLFEVNKSFADLFSTYNKGNVQFLAINSTNPTHPQFGGDVERKKKWSIPHPILLDPNGTVGKLYGAKTTPHFFVISSDGIVRYAGAIDDDPQNSKSAKEKINYARQAIDEVLAGKAVTVTETRPYGCGVKYAQDPAATGSK
jgi:peroxiredoxin